MRLLREPRGAPVEWPVWSTAYLEASDRGTTLRIQWPRELDEALTEAARSWGINKSEYVRRAVAKDLGLLKEAQR